MRFGWHVFLALLMCLPSLHAACSNPPVGTIFCDDFEAGNLNSWDQADTSVFSINTNAAFVKTGTRSLQGTIRANGGSTMDKWFMPGYDEIWVRMDVLFEPGFVNMRSDGYGMHFFGFGGNDINNQWSSFGKAGIQPSGTDYFGTSIDPSHTPFVQDLRPLMFYTYWPEMSCPSPTPNCYGNEIQQPNPQTQITAGTWQQYVIHLKANTVGQHDGLEELYIDGVKKISLTGMRWRDTNNLKWNSLDLFFYMPGAPKTESIWLDNIVISTQSLISGGTTSSLPGDINGDGSVNIQDMLAVGSCTGKAPTGSCAGRDLTGDGQINLFDFVAVARNWGQTATADTTAPTASITAPTASQVLAAGTTNTTLSVTTNEAATCKWSTTDVAYASMTNTFTTTGGTSHSTGLTGLANGNSYTRYVRCTDTAGNPMTASQSRTFSVASAAAVCGNSIVEAGEQCDTGASRGACPATCSLTCTTNSCGGAQAGLIAAYGFEENAGTTTADSSGFTNTGTLTNGVAWAVGKNGRGLTFDGVNDYVQMPSSASLNAATSGITIEFWMNPVAGSSDEVILSKPNVDGSNAATPYQYGIEIDGNGDKTFDGYLMTSAGGNQVLLSSQPVTYGSWNHYALVADGSGMRLYKNGVLVGSQSGAASIPSRATPLRIGVDAGLSQRFAGLIDDLRIYSRALSAAEITTDMNTPISPVAPPVCGNGVIEGSEQCDGAALNGASCTSLGYVSGTLSCTGSCTYNAAACVVDTTNPSVSITAPANAATITSTTTVSASASDNVGIQSVQFLIDGNNLGTADTTAPYSVSLNPASYANSAHTLTARATDTSGNAATSSAVSITVTNPPDTTPPTATITGPSGTLPFGTTSTTLSVTTNEAATCKWSTTDVAYASMTNTFTTTGGTSHSTSLTGLTNGGSYTRYVRCIDTTGNPMTTSQSVTFSVSSSAGPTWLQNKPAAVNTLATDYGFSFTGTYPTASDTPPNQFDGSGWGLNGGTISSVQDPTAPKSPQTIAQVDYPGSGGGGGGSGNFYFNMQPNTVKRIYVCINVKHSPNFEWNTVSNKFLVLFGPNTPGNLNFESKENGDYWSFGPFWNPQGTALDQNWYSGYQTDPGTNWHMVEMYVDSVNDRAQVWLDGAPVFDQTIAQGFEGGWDMLLLSSTWGGGGTHTRAGWRAYDHITVYTSTT